MIQQAPPSISVPTAVPKPQSDPTATSVPAPSPPPGTVKVVRKADEADVGALVTIHTKSLPDDFLVRLGPAFLTCVLYPTFLASRRVCIYVARRGGKPAGFIVTRIGFGGLLGEVMRHEPLWFLAVCITRLLRHPSLLKDCLSILAQLRTRAAEPDDPTQAELFLMAVAPNARRCGVARALIEHSAAQLRAAGVRSYRVLLHADNDAADAAYRNTGFTERRVYRFGNRTWRERERRLMLLGSRRLAR